MDTNEHEGEEIAEAIRRGRLDIKEGRVKSHAELVKIFRIWANEWKRLDRDAKKNTGGNRNCAV
jgi:hypothetical protein